MQLTSVLRITGFSIGLYPDHRHHHVLCGHIHGWHSPHGHLVLLDKGKQRPSFYVTLKTFQIHYWLLMNTFFFFSCTKSDLRELAPRLSSFSAWFFSWLSFTPATWSTASPHNMSCMAARNTSYRWGKIYVHFRVFSRFLVSLMRAGSEDGALTMAASASQWVQTTPVQLGVGSSVVSAGW